MKTATVFALVTLLVSVAAALAAPENAGPWFYKPLALASTEAGGGGGGSEPANEEASNEALAKQAQNPVAKLISVPFQNNFNFKYEWYLTTSPIITADWKASSDNRWTVRIGGGVGKIIRLGKLPVNLQLAAYHNVETPKNLGTDWQLRFQFQFLFPK